MASSKPTMVYTPQQREAGSLSPAFTTTTSNDTSLAGLAIFTNPVQGNTDTTSTHTGDLGGTATGL